jgi:hypothetical protein
MADWPGFYSSGVNQEQIVFTLVSGQASDGGYVGPYRACPYGAESNIFELEFSLPQGLGKLTLIHIPVKCLTGLLPASAGEQVCRFQKLNGFPDIMSDSVMTALSVWNFWHSSMISLKAEDQFGNWHAPIPYFLWLCRLPLKKQLNNTKA